MTRTVRPKRNTKKETKISKKREKGQRNEWTNERYLTNPILKRFSLTVPPIVLYCRLGFNEVNEYWMILFSLSVFVFHFLLFDVVSDLGHLYSHDLRHLRARRREGVRIHDSQNTYPIEFLLSAGCRCHSFNCMEMAGRMDSRETKPYLLFTSIVTNLTK